MIKETIENSVKMENISVKLPKYIIGLMKEYIDNNDQFITYTSILEDSIKDTFIKNNIGPLSRYKDFRENLIEDISNFILELADRDLINFYFYIGIIKNEIYELDKSLKTNDEILDQKLINRTREILRAVYTELSVPEIRRLLKTITFNEHELIEFYKDLFNMEEIKIKLEESIEYQRNKER